jgi:uncharacterized glyoxalase superfamily protein PhnB
MVTGSSRIAPYLIVRGAQRAIAFYRAAFGATESGVTLMPDGRIGHCELTIGGLMSTWLTNFPNSRASLGRNPCLARPSSSILKSATYQRPFRVRFGLVLFL